MLITHNLHFNVSCVLAQLHDENGTANHLIGDLDVGIAQIGLVVHEANALASPALGSLEVKFI